MNFLFRKLSLLTVIISSFGCSTREMTCPRFDPNNPVMDYAQITKDIDSVRFVNENDTLVFIKDFYGFSDSRIEKCGGFADPTCSCSSIFESTYRSDTIFLNNDIVIREIENEPEITVDINYQSNGFRWTSERITNTRSSIDDYFNGIEKDEVNLDGTTYFNLIEIENMNSQDKLISKMYIQREEGLVGFILNEDFFVRILD